MVQLTIVFVVNAIKKCLAYSKIILGLFGAHLSLIPKGTGEKVSNVTLPYLTIE